MYVIGCNELSIKEANIKKYGIQSIISSMINQRNKYKNWYFTSPYLLLSKELDYINNKYKSTFGASK